MLSTSTLQELESKIQEGLSSFYEAGCALREIRDGKLYRPAYNSFQTYCAARWRLQKSQIYRLICAAEVVENLSPTGELPRAGSQAWPLASLEPEQQREAWTAALTIEHQPTQKTVERAAKAAKSATPAWEVGERLTIAKGDGAGEVVTVSRVDGLIVHAETVAGPKPFFANELTRCESAVTTVTTVAPAATWTQAPTKADKMEALELELQVAEARIDVLEDLLVKALSEVGEELKAEISEVLG